MNTKKYMIIIKGEFKTASVKSCRYNNNSQRWDVVFNSGKKFPYLYNNVEKLTDPVRLNPSFYRVSRKGQNRTFFNINAIYVFERSVDSCWHICFEDGTERDYYERELNIIKSCLSDSYIANVFDYIKEVAKLNTLPNENSGEKLLAKKFEKITFVRDDVALAKYLDPQAIQRCNISSSFIPIFPFGCNNSQYLAVKRAMENQFSVIQGPPGTGKTQTILNIIANILMQDKTVLIVSNNNAATANVYEKLSDSKYNLGFIAAILGSKDNKTAFVEGQAEAYPDFALWFIEKEQGELQRKINEKTIRLKQVFDKQEELARLRLELSQLQTEFEYFKKYCEDKGVDVNAKVVKKKTTSEKIVSFWQKCVRSYERKEKIGIWLKLQGILKCGIGDMNFYKQEIEKVIPYIQATYYQVKEGELKKSKVAIEKYLKKNNKGLLDEVSRQSMVVLKDKLARKYEGKEKRPFFVIEDLWKHPYDVLEEYPVILSTTFSATSNLNPEVIFDYLIMDEASQVDVATGSLALSCAKSAIIVGDTKQLPNVVKGKVKTQAEAIFNEFMINEGYQYTRSFLQSVLDVMPNVTQTLLREHYRCHPKIINYCNQKFYKGELVVMTEDKGEEDVLAVVKTVPGNHARKHYSQRQIDVIREEIIPKYVMDAENTGIIAPYRDQVKALDKEFKDYDVATVHKFQGREKDVIIISTVDDAISDFADDPYLINVAVSRAKKQLMLVVSGNEQSKEGNITDLVGYIQYNNFEVVDSNIYSIFDYLYKQYAEARKIYLQKRRRVSKFDSENLMNALLEDVLEEDKFSCLDFRCFVQLNSLVKNYAVLDEEECKYAKRPGTHIDFLIYNRLTKKPVLAVEVDGYDFHKENTAQFGRDRKKDHILELCGIPLLRFKTNGSEERKIIEQKLDEIMR